MSLTQALQILSFQLRGCPETSPPAGGSPVPASHINMVARRNRVRGAGSEPHYTAASFNPHDGNHDNAIG